MADKKGKQQSIESLTQKFDELKERRTTAAANLKHVEAQLEKLKKQAKDQFKTDDPEELKNLLGKLKAENEKKRAEYQAHLEDISKRLEELEQP
jgi:predicted  nucleic acid-binding Zn-ribbon protein